MVVDRLDSLILAPQEPAFEEGVGRLVVVRAVRTHFIVLRAVLFEQDPSLQKAREQLSVKEFIAKPTVEALRVGILPRASGFDVERPGADLPPVVDPAL